MMQTENIKKIYGSYSRVYDFFFGQFFYPRQKHVIETMQIKSNERVLDLGVGTGLSLPVYPSHCSVTGIDLSTAMLKEAHKKVRKHNLSHVSLHEMDASNLQFEDNSFDHVIATFVISVVPDPVKVISEMKRVVKKDGRLVIVNHFKSKNPYIATIEKAISPLCCRMGWRTDLELDGLIESSNLQVDSKYTMKKIDLWKVIFAVNNK